MTFLSGKMAAAAAAALTAVASDDKAGQAGTTQSDTDFNAGSSAQSQPDQP